MPPKQKTPPDLRSFRIPDELIERLDAFAETLRAKNPGLSINRSDAIRALLSTLPPVKRSSR